MVCGGPWLADSHARTQYQRESDERRREVLEAAVTCFARKGFNGTTTHEIAESAGISRPYV
ncbi:TetR/AcrR family transcriptional regulator [Nocardiopsis sp. B62]|uniref:TetR/AcrR family transcriptional regulator n=1 Tax=Nocardiopsis sp. B62 TaxID=2824874 RepID=UPI0035B06D9F